MSKDLGTDCCGGDCGCKPTPTYPEGTFNMGELAYFKELETYVAATYNQHYVSDNGRQTMHDIIDKGEGIGFCKGNMRKYLDRYGRKEGKNRKDLLKLAHYAILLLISHDKENEKGHDNAAI